MLVRASALMLALLLSGCCFRVCTDDEFCGASQSGGGRDTLAGSQVNFSERWSESEHLVAIGVRLVKPDAARIATARSGEVLFDQSWLNSYMSGRGPIAAPARAVRIKIEKLRGSYAFVFELNRLEGDVVRVTIPRELVLARRTFVGQISRPEGRRGWYPERYCVNYYVMDFSDIGDVPEDERIVPVTTIGVDEFSQPGHAPPAGETGGLTDGNYGCSPASV